MATTAISQDAVKRSAVTGAAVGAMVATTVNYRKVKSGEIEKEEGMKRVAKSSLQASIGSGAVAAALSTNDNIKRVLALGLGVAGVVAVEKLEEKLNQKKEEGVVNE